MKRSLYFIICIILSFSGNTLNGQTVVLSENFSGFTTGTHASPATYDYSVSLDSKMQVPGWTGLKINSAAGEIKVGTATETGWIETPLIDLSSDGGKFIMKFDICRWPADATTVQVLLNGTAIGSVITPGDSFETIVISGTGGIAGSKLRIAALTKRFYLDNLSVTVNNLTTGIRYNDDYFPDIKIYPVPAGKTINIGNAHEINSVEICDNAGRILSTTRNNYGDLIQVDVEGLKKGIYIIRLISGKKMQVKRFIKL